MRINGVCVYYYESFPIEKLDYFDIPPERTGGHRTGGMGVKEFNQLVESIKTEGLINPVIVEDNNTSLKVQLGNNRCMAMKELGYDTIKAVVSTKNSNPAPEPGAMPIPVQHVDYWMKELHPGDEKWIKTAYLRQVRSSFRQVDP